MTESRMFHPFFKYDVGPFVISPNTIVFMTSSMKNMMVIARFTVDKL